MPRNRLRNISTVLPFEWRVPYTHTHTHTHSSCIGNVPCSVKLHNNIVVTPKSKIIVIKQQEGGSALGTLEQIRVSCTPEKSSTMNKYTGSERFITFQSCWIEFLRLVEGRKWLKWASVKSALKWAEIPKLAPFSAAVAIGSQAIQR